MGDQRPARAAKRPLSPGKKIALTVAGTSFWCGLTGCFVALIVGSILKQLDAKRRFHATEGVVLSARIESHQDSDGTTYEPAITYRYAVDGVEYTSDRYAFGMASTNDYEYVADIVGRYAAAERVTVYYDPDDPRQSVLYLQVPGIHYVALLFLQPFLLIGLFLIGHTEMLPGRLRRAREFLAKPMQVPCHIPTWGDLRHEMGGVAIQGGSKPVRVLLAAAIAYGLTCFVAVLVVGFLLGISEADARKIGAIFIAAAGVVVLAGLLAMVRGRTRRGFTLTPPSARLSLQSRRRNVELSLSQVLSWLVRSIPTPHWTQSEIDLPAAPLLAVAADDEQEVPIHVFRHDEAGRLIAEKVARGLAELTGKPVNILEGPPAPPAGGPPMSIVEGIDLVRKLSRARKEYADLT